MRNHVLFKFAFKNVPYYFKLLTERKIAVSCLLSSEVSVYYLKNHQKNEIFPSLMKVKSISKLKS